MSATAPTICRLVHFVSEAPFFATPPLLSYQKPDAMVPVCRAGIITGVNEDGTVSIYSLPADEGHVPLLRVRIGFAERQLAVGTWHWPTACPAEHAQ